MAFAITSTGTIVSAVGTEAAELLSAASIPASSTEIEVSALAGNDVINTTAGTNALFSVGLGKGDDTFNDAANNVYLNGSSIALGDGNDSFVGNTTSVLSGTISGGAGNDTINGGFVLVGGSVRGGQGDDAITVDDVAAGFVGGGKGNDTIVTGTLTNSTVRGGNGVDRITYNSVFDMLGSAIEGGAGNDVLVNGVALTAATLNGGQDSDFITGNTGVDTINGGDGTDIITGGLGADTQTGGAGVDTFIFGATSGTSALTSTATVSTALLAGNTISAGQTITFAAGAVDTITDFTTGEDLIDAVNVGATSLLGTLNTLVNQFAVLTTSGYLNGIWDSASNTFTITANGAGSDTLFFNATNPTLTTTANFTLLAGNGAALGTTSVV